MSGFEVLFSKLASLPEFQQAELQHKVAALKQLLNHSFETLKHGDYEKWQQALSTLPKKSITHAELADCITIGKADDLDKEQQQALIQALRLLKPWRKGPYQFFHLHIDCEWRSDWKWQRLKNHISSLQNKTVLDVGCGNGYHLWRMHEAGAKLAIGIDPSLLFWKQFEAVQHYLNNDKLFLLPLRLEQMPSMMQSFDSVFSMGVLYHRRAPMEHLTELRNALKEGGELILETLVIADEKQKVLSPKDRYAMMANVYFIPSLPLLCSWLVQCGFHNVRVVDVNQTSTSEQRSTIWSGKHSLKDFLDPNNMALTIEGYPAPLRAIVLANK